MARIRSDLKAMPAIPGAALAAMMPAHEMCIVNLVTVHESVTKGMKYHACRQPAHENQPDSFLPVCLDQT